MRCGCVPGYRHCPLAVSLWAAVNAAYEAWQASRDERDWETYKLRFLEYDAHVGES